jgi:hypothetical protein
MDEYKVIYDIGTRLFRTHITFTDLESARKTRDYLRAKNFDAAIVSIDYRHEMHSGWDKVSTMIELGFTFEDPIERPNPIN